MLKSQDSVMAITSKMEIASLVGSASILQMENALIKIVLLTVPMKCVPHVEMASESMQMETVNSQIKTVLLSTAEDAKFVVRDGTQAPEEIALDFQSTASSAMLSLKDLALNALTDFLLNQTVLVLQSLKQLLCQTVQLS